MALSSKGSWHDWQSLSRLLHIDRARCTLCTHNALTCSFGPRCNLCRLGSITSTNSAIHDAHIRARCRAGARRASQPMVAVADPEDRDDHRPALACYLGHHVARLSIPSPSPITFRRASANAIDSAAGQGSGILNVSDHSLSISASHSRSP
jgi:hypothetical protein